MRWIARIGKLAKFDFKYPQPKFLTEFDVGSINIDFSFDERYSGRENDEKFIYVRKDYYDNQNYFHVSCAETIEYRMDSSRRNKKLMEDILYDINQ